MEKLKKLKKRTKIAHVLTQLCEHSMLLAPPIFGTL